MTFETIDHTKLEYRLRELINIRGRKFEIVAIIPTRYEHGLITQYKLCYWLIK